MGKRALKQLWQWLSLALLYYLVGSALQMSGAQNVTGVPLLVTSGREATAYFAAAIGALLLTASMLCAIRYSFVDEGGRWNTRIPALFLTLHDPGEWDAKLFKVITASLFVLLPVIMIWGSVSIAEQANLCQLDTSHREKGGFGRLWETMVPKEQTIKKSDYEDEAKSLSTNANASPAYKAAINEEIASLNDDGKLERIIGPGQIRLVADKGDYKYCIGKIVGGIEINQYLTPLFIWVFPCLATLLALGWLLTLFRCGPDARL